MTKSVSNKISSNMKLPTRFILMMVWLATVLAAFAIGRGLQLVVENHTITSKSIESSNVKKNDLSSEYGSVQLEITEDLLPKTQEDVNFYLEVESKESLEGAFLLPLTNPKRANIIKDLLVQMASDQPELALLEATKIASVRDQERAINSILQAWGATNPNAALSWADSHIDQIPKQVMNRKFMAIFRGYAQSDPTAAFAQAYGMKEATNVERRLKNNILSEVIEMQVRQGGLVLARATVESMQDGDTKNRLLTEMVDEWAEYDPTAAAKYVKSLGESATTWMKASLISEWAESDPISAADWLSNLDIEDPAFGRGTASIIREWSQYDLSASAEWLNTLPASPQLDRAVASYTFRAAQEDPANAMSWAESISNERMQGYLMERVAANWKDQDPSAFAVYLESSEFSDEIKERLENATYRDGPARHGPFR